VADRIRVTRPPDEAASEAQGDVASARLERPLGEVTHNRLERFVRETSEEEFHALGRLVDGHERRILGGGSVDLHRQARKIATRPWELIKRSHGSGAEERALVRGRIGTSLELGDDDPTSLGDDERLVEAVFGALEQEDPSPFGDDR
jgi:hypothetical protein